MTPKPAFEVTVRFWDKIPVNQGSRRRKYLEEGAILYSVTAPDVDNRVKPVIDGIKGYWKDDRQVARLIVEKYYGLEEKMEFEVKRLPG